ncbi:MAG TPA: HAD-IB family hydrolase [Acidimicrobiales bacterium]|nr:HAD-IB family hydrolase [Acidimicrobiales bacterium]
MEAAFFDLDKTVIAKASMVAFGRSFYREGLISRRLLVRALWGHIVYLHLGASEEKLARLRDSVLALARGWHRDTIRRIVDDALHVVVEPIIYAEAAELIERHRREGRPVVLVSASPEEIVEPLGRFLGVEAVIATRAEVDAEGRYTGRTGFYAYGPFKAEAMQTFARERGIDLSASYAYSDSATDIPMLEAVGHAAAVNPDRVLARYAHDRGWEVLRFVRPVRLRDRLPAPPPAPTVGAALAAGAAAGGFAWWRIRAAERAAAAARAEAEARRRNSVVGRLYSARSFLAAMLPRATRATSRKSFFMGRRA